jgi:mRNA interferase HigB
LHCGKYADTISVMLIHGKSVLVKAMKKFANARKPLATWINVVEGGIWNNIVEVRESFATADAIRGTLLTCFNIGGNNFRLITKVSYEKQAILVVEFLTHAEYNRKYVKG